MQWSKRLEEEVRNDFHIFYIAHQLGKDIDEILEWNFEKILKWSIYFKILLEEQSKALKSQKIIQSPQEKKYLFVFR